MPARAKSHVGSQIVGRIVDTQRVNEGLSFQKAASLCGLHSAQHLHRICKGLLPLQYPMLERVARALNFDLDDLTLLWNVGRLLDERVPASRIAFLCPSADLRRPAVAGVAGPLARTGGGGDAGVSGDDSGHGGAAAAKAIDVALLLRLLQQAGHLDPDANGHPEKVSPKLLWMVGRLVAVLGALVPLDQLIDSARHGMVLIISKLLNRQFRANSATPLISTLSLTPA